MTISKHKDGDIKRVRVGNSWRTYIYVMNSKGFTERLFHSVNEEPAIKYDDGAKYWYKMGKLHREDGPAYVNKIIGSVYYLNGESYTKEAYTKEIVMRNLSPETDKAFGKILKEL